MTDQVVTANRLGDGEVVYWTKSGDWSTTLEDGAVATTESEAKSLLAHAQQQDEMLRVVDPYLFKVFLENGNAAPIGQREAIRALGPTIHPHFSKKIRLK